MKIITLSAENFKRLRAVEITPDGNMVEIRGKNAAGKSSVLDAIEAVFAGAGGLPKKPIRRGTTAAVINVDIGGLRITREFRESGKSSLIVKAQDGARYPSPQRMLDELVGAVAFDPLEFTRMKPEAQRETLRGLVKIEVDIDALDGQNERDYEKRREVNRDAQRLRAQASGIHYPEGLPARPVDIRELAERLRAAGEHNTALERLKAQRAGGARDSTRDRRAASEMRERAKQLREEAYELDREAKKREEHADDRDAEWAKKAEGEPIDTADLTAAIDQAREANAHLIEKQRRDTLEAEAAALEARSATLTATMQERVKQKAEAIAHAEMPVEGLALGDGEVLFNGLPLDQASQAEKIRVSVAIAMAANPKLHVLCIRDGSLLDQESMRLLAELIQAQDYQCWLEITDDDGKTGIIIEDGAVRGSAQRETPDDALPLLAQKG